MRILLIIFSISLFAFSKQSLASTGVAIASCETETCKEKFKNFKKFAKNGSPQAQMVLAGMYYSGYGVDKNVNRALRWYRKASRHQLSFATYRAGLMFLFEPEVEQNIPKGLEFLERATDLRSAAAANTLADIYIQGSLVEKDLRLAANWLNKASDLGDKHAQFKLAQIYDAGVLGNDDKAIAIALYKKSAEQNHDKAYQRLIELGAIKKRADIFASTQNEDIERIEVTAPKLEALLDISLLSIKESKQYNQRQSCSRVPTPICKGVQISIIAPDDIEIQLTGR